MSKAEAEEYTRDSYYRGQDFYHGTSQEAADAIVNEGARLTSEVVNSYGDGFYFAFAKDIAKQYASEKDPPTILTARVIKNPRKFRDSIDFDDFLGENNILADDSQSKAVSRILISQEFDAVEIGGDRILVVIFNQDQIAIFQSENYEYY